MKQNIRKIRNSKHMVVPADKSQNLYKIPVPTYQKLLKDEVNKSYKLASKNDVKCE